MSAPASPTLVKRNANDAERASNRKSLASAINGQTLVLDGGGIQS
jgi:hypothetical protein